MMDRDIENYYRQRAEEYDAVYRKPERQGDIAKLGQRLTELLQGHRVLEVAAGTGFWTERITSSVTSLVATDAVEDTLAVARRRDYGGTPVELIVCDAFALDRIPGTFDAGLACFWLSHLTRDQMRPFLDHLNSRLEPNSRVVLVDNRYVAGSNHPITRTDHAGNTYQRRVLNSGQQFEILKNFLNHHELHDPRTSHRRQCHRRSPHARPLLASHLQHPTMAGGRDLLFSCNVVGAHPLNAHRRRDFGTGRDQHETDNLLVLGLIRQKGEQITITQRGRRATAALRRENTRFSKQHGECRAGRHRIANGPTHCMTCCPPPPLSDNQIARIAAILQRH